MKHIAYRGGVLCIEGVPVDRIATRVGTPTYVYSTGYILDRLREFQRVFAARKHLICYALKANSSRSVCRILSRAGAGAEVVSGGELKRALAAGFHPEGIVFSGVGKTDAEMALALKARILSLNVESAQELSSLSRVARRLRRVAPFSVRVVPGVAAGAHAHVSTGHSRTKFGVEPSEALILYAKARRDAWLEAVGIQSHIGSQITLVEPYRRELAVLLRLVDRLAAMGIRLRHLDIGGGMGIRYRQESPLNLGDLARLTLKKLAPYPGLRLLLEPGRYLTGGGGVLLTRVITRKRGGRNFIVVDAAMNDLARPALYDAYHEIVPAAGLDRPRVRLDVVGPICESGDFLGRDRRLPWPEPGELWAVMEAGAYGFSMSSQYNSRPRAAEVLVAGSHYRIVRKRETFLDIVRHER